MHVLDLVDFLVDDLDENGTELGGLIILATRYDLIQLVEGHRVHGVLHEILGSAVLLILELVLIVRILYRLEVGIREVSLDLFLVFAKVCI